MNQKFLTGQAVILAAGQGIRARPLTSTKPKPLLKILGKTILEHNLEQLRGLVNEVILVIGYKGEIIEKFFGNRYKNLKIKYVWQKEQLGTGDAAQKVIPFLKDKFFLLNGDDLYDKNDFQNCLKKFPSILIAGVKNPVDFGQVIVGKKTVKEFIEKPEKELSNLVNCAFYFLDKSIFKLKIEKSKRGEYEFPDFLRNLIENKKLFFVIAKNWLPLPYSWNLLDANQFLLNKIKRSIKGKIEKNCQISGKVVIEKGTLIKSGTYIEGPVFVGKNCQIGPHCYLRGPISLGDNCHLGQAVEIKNSIIGDDSKIPHLNYLGDSILGQNCNLGAGTILANLRFDKKNIKVNVEGKQIDSQKIKLGAILGDNVNVGINCSLMPGVLIGANSTIGPHSVVFENIKENTNFYRNLSKPRQSR